MEKNVEVLEFIKEHSGALTAFSVFFGLTYYLLQLIENPSLAGDQFLFIIPMLSLMTCLIIGISIWQKMRHFEKKSPMLNMLFYTFTSLFIGLVYFFCITYNEVLSIVLNLALFSFALIIINVGYERVQKTKYKNSFNVIFTILIISVLVIDQYLWKMPSIFSTDNNFINSFIIGFISGIGISALSALNATINLLFPQLSKLWDKMF